MWTHGEREIEDKDTKQDRENTFYQNAAVYSENAELPLISKLKMKATDGIMEKEVLQIAFVLILYLE